MSPTTSIAPLLWLLLLLLVNADASSGDSCEQQENVCQAAWSRLSGNELESDMRCHLAVTYRECLEKVNKDGCSDTTVPLTLQLEESLYCHMPQQVYTRKSACQTVQTQCMITASTAKIGKTDAKEICRASQEERACLRNTIWTMSCPDYGGFESEVEKEIAVNCIGGDSEECEHAQKSCQKHYAKAIKGKHVTAEDRCAAAREFRECLAMTARSGYCDESVIFPDQLDKAEKKYCPDYIPRPSCREQADACKATWDLVVGTDSSAVPQYIRCAHAQKWKICLQRIIMDGGCEGGYTLDVDAQVEVTMACHIEHDYNQNECDHQISRCTTEYQIKRKYLSETKELCDNVLEDRACLQQTRLDGVCPKTKADPSSIDYDEEVFCKDIFVKECKRKTDECEKTFNAKIKGERLYSKLCAAATSYRKCIEDSTTRLCKLKFPADLVETEKDNCGKPDLTPCEQQMEDCEADYDRRHARGEDTCDSAQKWRDCLELLPCHVIYPSRLNNLQSSNNCHRRNRNE